ncbi:c-type cytochrome [Defluviimonas salinarum]|uniref:Cytochrome c n=1 Tax=Defluviimonas salinarum TaxID=2992147 RepID=A0ABT3J0D8_9RHOB|nr:cytochrome c [Defluviimonas salinarum]MCW3781147.1 cytochrome c [Defluviimonas salinarum]
MKTFLLTITAATILITGVATAQDAPFAREIKVRQGIMGYRTMNVAILGAMAKGEVDYNAEQAQKAADNLLTAASIDMSMLWPEGSDDFANPDTRALAKIWEGGSDVGAKAQALVDAATAMQAAAGIDLASLQGALKGVGDACTACHEAYRASAN